MTGIIVPDIIAHIGVGRVVNRAEPHRTDAQPLQIIQPPDNSSQIADTVPVGVLKAAGIDLIENAFFPPLIHLIYPPSTTITPHRST